MKFIEVLAIIYLLFILAIAIYLHYLYIDIRWLRNSVKRNSVTPDNGPTFAPLPFYEEYQDTEEIKQLIKKRNRISILFCFLFFIPFVIEIFIKIN